MMSASEIEHRVSSADLVSALEARAREIGGNDGGWPGLTLYRYIEPTAPAWEEIRSLSLGIVAQGSKAVIVDGARYVYDPFHYLVLGSNLHFQAEVLQAGPCEPFLSFVLEIDPALVRKVSTDMLGRRSATSAAVAEQEGADRCVVSPLDPELMAAVLRFLRSLDSQADRRVLAPMCVEEMVYRVLRREQFARMLHIAARQVSHDTISAALTFARAHYAEPLTVNDLARQAALSPSAFSALFREVTGRTPYRFLKEYRLDRGRELLVDRGMGVAEASRQVGYASVSHFIKEFRNRFGVTPRAYVDAHNVAAELRRMHPDAG
ncbi:transcriptional regulator [Sphaerisporangium melleum]|uniref:Transcriptional regulator n=1 Tax=Sphaerisporangium melleum TaxID=321316 RepID=A0A917R3A9_9ACTN|nr:AraC family transcriptional regulator [Sphaerisporangium melleum]GGK87647.1 transcriptional regulator [Sphaerisporangium melleum]GII72430.1 transcriptional regulator [Sphaerisporangium melleum]